MGKDGGWCRPSNKAASTTPMWEWHIQISRGNLNPQYHGIKTILRKQNSNHIMRDSCKNGCAKRLQSLKPEKIFTKLTSSEALNETFSN